MQDGDATKAFVEANAAAAHANEIQAPCMMLLRLWQRKEDAARRSEGARSDEDAAARWIHGASGQRTQL